MFFERVESKGLAHYSYMIGDGNEVVVIDPRRDCDVYLQETLSRGLRITDIIETHCNEDYLVGSLELEARTGARIWHADSQLSYHYGQSVRDGQTWETGGLALRAVHSPGHTLGSMSYLLHDHDGHPWMIFTGDALFAGDVGRVDLLGVERADEMARLLHDTIFNRLLPLDDEVIVCPAHGAGSICGAAIAERVWTTMGMERKFNPRLRYKDREEFVAHVAIELERPPYFTRMEKLNVEGPPLLGSLPMPTPLGPSEFSEMVREAVVLDTRKELGFSAAHVPDSLSIWLEGVPAFAGWFLPYDKPILLVNETNNFGRAVRYLIRIGYDRLAGCLSGGMLAWHKAGKESNAIGTVSVQKLCRQIDNGERIWILDVRSKDELVDEGEITGAHHIHITQLLNHLDEVPKDNRVHIFCGSGLRSMIAASLLQSRGWKNLTVVLGGMAAWNSMRCPAI